MEPFKPAMSTSEEAILFLGPHKRVVTVNEATIRERSAYLNHLFEATEADDARFDGQVRSILKIPNHNSDTLNTYIHWLQGHTVLPSYIRTKQAQYKFYALLYVFGEEIHDQAFQDATIDSIVSASRQPERGSGVREYPNNDVVHIIYDGTPVGSPARHLMVDFWLCDSSRLLLASSAAYMQLPKPFLADLAYLYGEVYRTSPAPGYVQQRLDFGEPVKYHHCTAVAQSGASAKMGTIDEADEEGGSPS